MDNRNSSPLVALRWEFVQLFFCMIFLVLFYFQEMSASNYLGFNNQQVQAIHLFLNRLQFPLLPDYFFLLFFPLMLIAFSLIVFKKWRWFFLSFSGAFISTLLIADKIYFSFFSSLITMESFSAANQIWDIKSAIFKSITFKDLFLIVIFCIFIPFGILLNKKIQMGLPDGKITFAIDKVLGILFCLLAIYAYNIAFFIPKRYVEIGTDYVMHVSKTKIDYQGAIAYIPNYEASNMYYASTFGLMNFHIKNLADTFKNYFENKKSKNIGPPKGLYAFFDKKKEINEITSPFYGIAKGRNVFLIHFESLHPILIDLEVGGVPVTPTLNQFKKDNLYWNYILDQVTIGGSSDAEFAALTGMLPGKEKISAFNTSCMPHIPSLPRHLKSLGYQTISLHGYDSSFYNRNITQPLLGFETMYFKNAFKYKKKLGMGVPDKDFFPQSIDLLKKHSFPFFAFLMTLSSHFPYSDLPPDYELLFNQHIGADTTLIKYLQAIRYTDDALGDFFLKIKNAGLWENSIFIIYGDHRPGGADQEMIATLLKITGKSIISPRFSCVPVIIVIPGYKRLMIEYKKQYSDIVGGLYDIFPTIMHLLGEDAPIGVYGSHLFVQNIQRDPAPFFRFIDGFIFNGILYLQQGKEILTDNEGVVFTNNSDAVINSGIERIELYKKALLSIHYCDYVYTSDFDIGSLRTDN